MASRQTTAIAKMATTEVEKAFCVLEFARSASATDVQRKFRSAYKKDPPSRKTIYAWHKKFVTTGCLCDRVRSGRPTVSAEDVERVRKTFTKSPNKSMGKASRELKMPRATVWKIVRKKLAIEPSESSVVPTLTLCDAKKAKKVALKNGM